MKRTLAVRLLAVLFAFALTASAFSLLAGPPPPEASLTVQFARGTYTAHGSAKKGKKPYSYFWSVDGGTFQEGGQTFIAFFCGFNSSLAFKVIDDLGQESNVEVFVCP